jgi:hypothetical protein
MNFGQTINLLATIFVGLGVVGAGIGVYTSLESGRAVTEFHITVIEKELVDVRTVLSSISQTVIRTDQKTPQR